MKARNPSTGNLESVYVKALDSLPVGIILSFPTTSSAELPNGYMFCDGSAISRTTYSELFSLIGTSYGAGDGSTTFNLPNLKGRVQVGRDSTQTEFDTIGETGGSKELQAHSHRFWEHPSASQGAGSWEDLAFVMQATLEGGGNTAYVSETGTGNSGNLQPYIVSNFIIKVKQTVPLAASVLNANSNSTKDTYSCDHINNITGTPIWINLYGNSTFQPKEITGDFSQYSKFEIYAFVDTNGSVITHGTATKGTTKNIVYTSAYSRNFTITDTKITIAEGKYNNTTNNSAIIPAYILGYK